MPVYTLRDHIEAAESSGLRLKSGVHVEAIVGQCEGGCPLDACEETREVMEQVGGKRAYLWMGMTPLSCFSFVMVDIYR